MSRLFRVGCSVGVLCVLLGWAPQTAQASFVPYPNYGSPNTENYQLVVQNDGPVTGYFLQRNAAFTHRVGVSINGVAAPEGEGLDSGFSIYGDSFVLANAHAGDSVVFRVTTVNTWTESSEDHYRGFQSFYFSRFEAEPAIPTGLLMQFEDAYDLDYDDYRVVITNVENANAPEPATFVLAGLGGLGAVMWSRRSRRQQLAS